MAIKRDVKKFRRQVGMLALVQRYDHAALLIMLRHCSRMKK
jgi:hypothetical protein